MKSNWSLTKKCIVPKEKRDYLDEIESARKNIVQLKWLLSEAKKLNGRPQLERLGD